MPKNVMTYDQLDAMQERIKSNIYKCGDWWPTVKELEEKIGDHPEKYVEFLTWILETACEPIEEWQKQSKKYITKLLYQCIEIKEEE